MTKVLKDHIIKDAMYIYMHELIKVRNGLVDRKQIDCVSLRIKKVQKILSDLKSDELKLKKIKK